MAHDCHRHHHRWKQPTTTPPAAEQGVVLLRRSTTQPQKPSRRCVRTVLSSLFLAWLVCLGANVQLMIQLWSSPASLSSSSFSSNSNNQKQKPEFLLPNDEGRNNQARHDVPSSSSLQSQSSSSSSSSSSSLSSSYHKDSPHMAAQAYDVHHLPSQQLQGGGAFVHIGKTGGSSLSVLLRNGCHSYLPHPCRVVANETVASRRVVSYYHVADFGLLPQSQHDFYIVTVRDPFPRTLSALSYEHYDNIHARIETYSMLNHRIRQRYRQACQQCFPTIEHFVQWLDYGPEDDHGNDGTNATTTKMSTNDDPSVHFDYPYSRREIVINAVGCRNLVRAIFHGRIRHFNHLYFNYQRLRNLLFWSDGNENENDNNDTNTNTNTNTTTTSRMDQTNSKSTKKLPRRVFVTRLEQLWHDWDVMNQQLAVDVQDTEEETTIHHRGRRRLDDNEHANPQQLQSQQQFSPQFQSQQQLQAQQSQPQKHIRNTATLQQPVTRDLSDHGRQVLCRALQPEYNAYFEFLGRAVNLKKSDVLQSLWIAQQHCPNVHIDFHLLKSTSASA